MSQRYSKRERFFIAAFYEVYRSPVIVAREFKKRFGRFAPIPSRHTILSIHQKVTETGDTSDSARSGRPRSARSEENIARVHELFDQLPTSSLSNASLHLNLSETSIWRIWRKDLELRSWKLRLLHEISAEDEADRLDFCSEIVEIMEEDDTWINRICFSDEAHFHLSGEVNRHNCTYWSKNDPDFFTTKPLHSPRVTVWCGVWSGGIVGPYFFDGNVTGDSYLRMLEDFLLPELKKIPEFECGRLWFMQDGAPPHWSRQVRRWLDDKFTGVWLGRGGAIRWPARSPDLTPLDFWFWGDVKRRVYQTRPASLVALKKCIKEKINEITRETRLKSLLEFVARIKECKEKGGKHIEK